MKKNNTIFSFFILFLLFSPINSFAKSPDSLMTIKGASFLWTLITHPAETTTHLMENKNSNAELQHVIPQSFGGTDLTTAYWARSNHSVSDRWKDRPFLSEHNNAILSMMTFGNDRSQDNLNAAYRMGAYGLPYTVFFHHYRKDESSFVFTELDGPTMLVYGASWLLNMPQKLLNQLAYTIESNSEPNLFYIIDIFLAILVALLDFSIGVIFTFIGFFAGFILHPINSLCSLLGAVYFIPPIIWTAVIDFLYGLLRLLPFI